MGYSDDNSADDDSGDDLDSKSMSEDLSLPATGLRVTESDLILERKNGAIIQSWPLSELSEIRAIRQVNPFALALIGSGCSMVYIALSISLSWWLACGLYALAALCGLLGVLTLFGAALRFTYRGKTVSIGCDDEFLMVDAVAKILSLK
jgi:hypothetical protein